MPQPLFPRLDDKAQAADLSIRPCVLAGSGARGDRHPRPPRSRTSDSIDRTDELRKRQLGDRRRRLRARRAARRQVLAAQAIPKDKKLLQLTVDLGEAEPRSIVAGIAQAYQPDALVGKQVIVVANLAPTTSSPGCMSQGMILAAGDEAILGLSAVDHDVPPGTRVR